MGPTANPIEFQAFPKTPRLFQDCVITEKIDGTNGAIHVAPPWVSSSPKMTLASIKGRYASVAAQSRNRLVDPSDDNYGFAAWVFDNADALAAALGEGVHYGEWWGAGINRGYGLEKGDRRFSLFNVDRYGWNDEIDALTTIGLHVVPVLYEGSFDTADVDQALMKLSSQGSHAAPGFMRPEGVITWHKAARQAFKTTLFNDSPKGGSS